MQALIAARQDIVSTSHGDLAVKEYGRGDLPVIMIHGNSSSQVVFLHQLTSLLAESYRSITLDLPGHGASSDAPDPKGTYTRPGLADAVLQVLKRLQIEAPVVFGWSFGGHVAIEMAPHIPKLQGLVISGTPPVATGRMSDGFLASPGRGLAGRRVLSDADMDTFAHAVFGQSIDPVIRASMERADGRFRERVFEAAREGQGADQRAIVENLPSPIAAINGADDKIVNLDYFDGISWKNLWDNVCYRLPSAGHAPFLQAHAAFNAILARFLTFVEQGECR